MGHYVGRAGVYTSVSILLAVSTIAVLLRFKARRMKSIAFGGDDIAIYSGLILNWALGISMVVVTAMGYFGTHTALNPKTGKSSLTSVDWEVSKLGYTFQILIMFGDGILKVAILLLYRRIFVGYRFNLVTLFMIVLITCWSLSFAFATIFQCGSDPSRYWTNSEELAEYCHGFKDIKLGHAVSDVATDLIIISIPFPIIWRLHTTMGQKAGLTVIFLLGLISIIGGTIRMVFVLLDQYETPVGYRDLRGLTTTVSIWGFIELSMGLITACGMSFRPLLADKSTESIINSIRSAISLRSQSSRGSASNRTATANPNQSGDIEGIVTTTRKRVNETVEDVLTSEERSEIVSSK